MFIAKIFPAYVVCSVNEECDSFACSLVYDPVCGMTTTKDGTRTIKIYQNLCHLLYIKCQKSTPIIAIKQVPDTLCNIKKKPKKYSKSGRRLTDFGIVGAHQACNHTCPTYCIDTYEPACATVWYPTMNKKYHRLMVNHCHVDLFSCSLGLNVTIEPLNKCYKNPAGLLFMSQVAGLKSLGLLDEPGEYEAAYKAHWGKPAYSRRSVRSIFRSHLF